MNEMALETFCFEPFKQCMTRNPMEVRLNDKRADMVVSVHPLCQDLPLKILNELDSNGASRSYGRQTPFVTVVTDLGGAHPTVSADIFFGYILVKPCSNRAFLAPVVQ